MVEVRSSKFEFAHGRKPRGVGAWAFVVMNDREEVDVVWAPGPRTFSAAKRWAQAHVAQAFAGRFTHVEVGS